MENKLVGYIRKSKTGKALKINLDRASVLSSETYTTADGQEFIALVVSLDKVCQILANTRPVTSVCQLIDSDN